MTHMQLLLKLMSMYNYIPYHIKLIYSSIAIMLYMSCQHMLCTYIANSLIVIEMKLELHRIKKGNTCTLLIDVIAMLLLCSI